MRIPPFGSAGTTISTLPVGGWGRIQDLDVFIDLQHTFVGDLEIFLVGPDSTEVMLFNQLGLSDDDISAVTFDDEAPGSIHDGVPPFGPGRFRPDPGLLADFDGREFHGTWSLTVVDRFRGDYGTLVHWELVVLPVPEPSTLGLFVLFGASSLAARVWYPRPGSALNGHRFPEMEESSVRKLGTSYR